MRYSKEQIDQWITEWEQSGQSIYHFCKDKPFDKSTFYNWRKDVTGTTESKKGRKFTPLQVAPSYIPQVSIHYPNGIRVDMYMMMSVEQIRALAGC